MKYICILLTFYFAAATVIAQPTNSKGWYDRKDVENVIVGWMNPLTFKEPAKPFAQYGWSYTAKQTDCTQKFITWMQQTYTCKGLLGEPKLSVLAPEPALPKTNSSYGFGEAEKDNRKALPNTYGAWIRFHHNLVKTSTRKFAPMNGNMSYIVADMMANNVELFTRQIVSISSEEEFYCTMPRYRTGMKGEFDREYNEKHAHYRNFTNSPNLKKYEHYFVPGQSLGGKGAAYIVVMTKDRQPLPFEQVTIGELLSRLESRLPIMYMLAKNGGRQLQNMQEKAKAGLEELRKQFKNDYNKYAYFRSVNEMIDIIDLANIDAGKPITWLKTEAESKDRDYGSSNYPLLRLKKGVKEACATSGPQWIIFRMDAMIDEADAGNTELMDNFVSRFNYDYVYDYFFGNDKVIAPYQPTSFVTPEEKNNNQAPAVLSDKAKKYAADRSVAFFEDFSGVAIDAAPPTWTNERNQSGQKIGVKEVDGIAGKWLKLQKNAAPKQFSPVTGDFEFSFDVMVQKGDVPWGTPGIVAELKLGTSQGDKRFVMDVSPGDMNRKDAAGWVMLTIPSADCKLSNYYSLPDFTGSKSINKVTMTLKKKGQTATVLCNNNKVYECHSAFNGEMSLKGLNFYVNEKNSYYISNVIVRK